MLNLGKIGKKNIVLMGLMGSGKTVIGKKIANLFKMKYVDTDKLIEENQGKKIKDIFLINGEEYFREIEKDIVLNSLKLNNCIISLGGGSILNKKVREKIEKYSFSIYLEVKIKELKKRISNSIKRPLLKDVDTEEKLIELLLNREKFYKNADLIIKNDNSITDTLKEIQNILQKK